MKHLLPVDVRLLFCSSPCPYAKKFPAVITFHTSSRCLLLYESGKLNPYNPTPSGRASSLPGISTRSGSQSVSTIQIVGIPKIIHSLGAIDYSCWSVIVAISGKFDIYWIPPRHFFGLDSYPLKITASCFGSQSNPPVSSSFCKYWNLRRRVSVVNQFVNVPPNHLLFT